MSPSPSRSPGSASADPGDPIGDDVRREMLMTVVLEDDHGPRAVVAGHQHAEGATTRSRSPSPSISIGVTWAGAWTAATTVSANDPRGNCRIQLTRSRRASQTSTSGKAVAVEVRNLDVRNAGPFAGRGAIADWGCLKGSGRWTVRQHRRRRTSGLPVAGTAAAGDQAGADQQGEWRRPVETAPRGPHVHAFMPAGAGNYRPEWRARGDFRRRRCPRRCRSPARCRP